MANLLLKMLNLVTNYCKLLKVSLSKSVVRSGNFFCCWNSIVMGKVRPLFGMTYAKLCRRIGSVVGIGLFGGNRPSIITQAYTVSEFPIEGPPSQIYRWHTFRMPANTLHSLLEVHI